MEATDLRIGNFINFPFIGSDVIVIGLALPSIGDVRIQTKLNNNTFFELTEKYKPIPLTEELAIKLGFKNDRVCGNIYEIKKGNIIISIVIEKDTLLDIVLFNENITCVTLDKLKFKYVHQLQNLYYALTNEELTYGPN